MIGVTDTMMARIVSTLGDVDVLVYASSGLAWTKDARCKLTMFTPVSQTGARSVVEYHEYIRTNLQHRISAFEKYCRTTTVKYGLIYLDEGQSIDWYVRLVNTCRCCSLATAVFIIPGSDLPAGLRGGRNTAMPSTADERWIMPDVLMQSGAEVALYSAEEIGLTLATHVGVLDTLRASSVAKHLSTQISNGEQLAAHLLKTTVSDPAEFLDRAALRQRTERYTRVVIDAHETGVLFTEIDSFQSWVRPLPAFVADLSTNGTDTTKLLNTARSVHGVSVDEFHDVDLLGRDLILAGPRGGAERAIYGKNKQGAAMLGGLRTLADEVEWDAATQIRSDAEGNFYYPRSELDAPLSLSEGMFHVTPDEQFNFGMWLFYSVPGVRHYKRLKDRYPKVIASMSLPWQRRMLLDLGVLEDDLIQQDPTTVYRCTRLATMRQTYRSFSFPPSDREAFDEIAERAVYSIPGATPEKIFVSRLSRTKLGGHRGLSNEAELATALENLGFTTVEPEKYSLFEQAKLFRQAKSIVGLGGAAMFNTAFCKPGVQLVDIESSVYFMDAHANIFASRGLNYGLILGAPDLNDPSEHQKRWSVDVQRAVGLIKGFIS